MKRIEKTVFISYRRTDIFTALSVFQYLTQHGYDVFFDFDGIGSGDFERIIIENIKARAHFLVLLTPSALERCGDPADWLRREIETAIETERNIIPLMFDGFHFNSPSIANQLTGKLATLKSYNALPVMAAYFTEAMSRLREKYLNVPLEMVLHPASASAQEGAKAQKAAAIEAPLVKPDESVAEEKRRRIEEEGDPLQQEAESRLLEVEVRRRDGRLKKEERQRSEGEARLQTVPIPLRKYGPIGFAVAVVLIVVSSIVWWWKRQEIVGHLNPDKRRELRTTSAQHLAALIKRASTSGGGFRMDLDRPDSEADVWTSAQCISGLASAGLPDSREEIRHALAFISRSDPSESWGVEITSWVGIAFLNALHQDQLLVSQAERQNAIQKIRRVHRYLSERQSTLGGWSSYETYYTGPEAFAHYATFIAMKFLITLRGTKINDIDLSALDDQVRRGLAWVLGRYNSQVKGWNEYSSAATTQKDLATLYLLVLTEARRSGSQFDSFVTSYRTYGEALGQWIPSALNDSIRRKVGENTDLRQVQKIFDALGNRVDIKSRNVSILWHPWSLLLASYLAADDSLPLSQKNEALDLRDRLFRRLHETYETFDTGFTFAAAETLFALGSVK